MKITEEKGLKIIWFVILMFGLYTLIMSFNNNSGLTFQGRLNVVHDKIIEGVIVEDRALAEIKLERLREEVSTWWLQRGDPELWDQMLYCLNNPMAFNKLLWEIAEDVVTCQEANNTTAKPSNYSMTIEDKAYDWQWVYQDGRYDLYLISK